MPTALISLRTGPAFTIALTTARTQLTAAAGVLASPVDLMGLSRHYTVEITTLVPDGP